MAALALNSGGGGKTRSSRSVESMSWLATAETGPAMAETGREDIRTVLWGREIEKRLTARREMQLPRRLRVKVTLSREAHKRQVGREVGLGSSAQRRRRRWKRSGARRLHGLLLRGHILAQRGIDAALIAPAGRAKKRDQVGIEAQRDLLLVLRRNQLRDAPPAAAGLEGNVADVDLMVAQVAQRLHLLLRHRGRIRRVEMKVNSISRFHSHFDSPFGRR